MLNSTSFNQIWSRTQREAWANVPQSSNACNCLGSIQMRTNDACQLLFFSAFSCLLLQGWLLFKITNDQCSINQEPVPVGLAVGISFLKEGVDMPSFVGDANERDNRLLFISDEIDIASCFGVHNFPLTYLVLSCRRSQWLNVQSPLNMYLPLKTITRCLMVSRIQGMWCEMLPSGKIS